MSSKSFNDAGTRSHKTTETNKKNQNNYEEWLMLQNRAPNPHWHSLLSPSTRAVKLTESRRSDGTTGDAPCERRGSGSSGREPLAALTAPVCGCGVPGPSAAHPASPHLLTTSIQRAAAFTRRWKANKRAFTTGRFKLHVKFPAHLL